MPYRTVLYVEDNDLVARSVLRMSGLSFRLERVATAGEAESWLTRQNSPPRAVLVDQGLPDGDGAALARRIRERGLRAGVVSGGLPASDEDLPWLTKPFTRDQLEAFLQSL